MKTLSLILTLFIAAATLPLRATVNVLPMSPKVGEAITIEYTPVDADKQWAESASNLHAVVYTFTPEADFPTAVEVALTKKGQRWSGIAKLAADIVFAMIKVGDGLRYDNNKELFWNVFVMGANGKPLFGAHMKAGMAALGVLPPECKRKQDMNDAMEELTLETRHYPNNLAAQINLVMVSESLQLFEPAEAQIRIQQLIDSKPKPANIMDVIAIAQGYQRLQKPDNAMAVMSEGELSFPGTKITEQIKLDKLSKAKSLPEFVNGISVHLKQYPNSFAKQNLVDAAISATTRGGEMRLLIEFLDNTPGLTAIMYYLAVNYVGSQDSLRAEAFRILEKGLHAADNEQLRPIYAGQSEWKDQQRIAKSMLHFVNGAMLSNVPGKEQQGMDELALSIELGGAQTEKTAYEFYVGALTRAQKNDKAIEIAEKAISSGSATQGVLDAYRQLKQGKGTDSVQIEQDLAKLRAAGSKSQNERLAREMLNQGMIDGTFQTIDGSPTKISDWKGKVVLIDYWATWCGPCKKSFPSMQKLYEKYRNNPNVVFAIVNVWEKTEDRPKLIKDFLKENASLTFPVYLDKDDSVVGRFGVTGIPTKFFLGKDGRIQFKEVGFLPEEQFIEESSNRIELLLSIQ